MGLQYTGCTVWSHFPHLLCQKGKKGRSIFAQDKLVWIKNLVHLNKNKKMVVLSQTWLVHRSGSYKALQYPKGWRPSWYWRHLTPTLLERPTRQNISWAVLANRDGTSHCRDPNHTFHKTKWSLSLTVHPALSITPKWTPKKHETAKVRPPLHYRLCL